MGGTTPRRNRRTVWTPILNNWNRWPRCPMRSTAVFSARRRSATTPVPLWNGSGAAWTASMKRSTPRWTAWSTALCARICRIPSSPCGATVTASRWRQSTGTRSAAWSTTSPPPAPPFLWNPWPWSSWTMTWKSCTQRSRRRSRSSWPD